MSSNSTKQFISDSSIKRILKNGAFTAIRFVVYALSGWLLIPFLVREYGSGSYGLIALAGFLTQYVGMISECIGSSVARFLNIALNKNDFQQANEIFSTALIANFGFMLVQIPLFVLGVWKLNWLIDFPLDKASDFKILVICNIVIFFISMMKGVFQTPIQAANKLDLSMKIDMSQIVLRLIIIFALIRLIGPKLWIIGAVDLCLSILSFIVIFIIYRNIAQQLIFKKKFITVKWISPVLNMAGWSLISMLGFSLFLKTDIWMINRFINKEMAGVYAALLVWPNFIKQLGGMAGNLLSPVYTIDYARGDIDRVRNILCSSCQILSYSIACFGCIFIISSSIFLKFWLGSEYMQYAFWLQLLVGHIVFTIQSNVMWPVFVTLGKTRYLGIGNLCAGLANIILSLIMIRLGLGTLGVILGTIVAVSFKDNLLFPYWLSKELQIPGIVFIKIYIKTAVIFLLILICSFFFGWQKMEISFGRYCVMIIGNLSLAAGAVNSSCKCTSKSLVKNFSGCLVV